MAKEDYYKILGITDEEKQLQGKEFEKIAKKKYRAIALKNHPDKLGNASEDERKKAEETFKKASEAYEVLSDEEKRKKYDMGGMDFSDSPNFGDMDFEDILRHFGGFGGFGGFDPFGFGSAANREEQVQKGASIRIRLSLTLKEMQSGVTKKIRYKRYEVCKECGGSGMTSETRRKTCKTCGGTGMIYNANGFVQVRRTCPTCGGQGYILENPCHSCNGHGLVQTTFETELNIVKGVSEGMSIVFNGLGNCAPHGKGQNGDLIVSIVQEDDKTFERDGDDLYFILNVPVLDAILGTTQTVTTLDGKTISAKIPQGSSEGDKLRFKGYGMPRYGNPNVCGNMIGVVKIVMPKRLNDKERELLTELKEQEHFKK